MLPFFNWLAQGIPWRNHKYRDGIPTLPMSLDLHQSGSHLRGFMRIPGIAQNKQQYYKLILWEPNFATIRRLVVQ
jgi:hypothetical protein